MDIMGERALVLLDKRPKWQGKRPTNSIYCATSDLLLNRPQFLEKTSQFHPGDTWLDIGARILQLAGRRPDCACADAKCVARLPPPPLKKYKPLLIVALTANK